MFGVLVPGSVGISPASKKSSHSSKLEITLSCKTCSPGENPHNLTSRKRRDLSAIIGNESWRSGKESDSARKRSTSCWRARSASSAVSQTWLFITASAWPRNSFLGTRPMPSASRNPFLPGSVLRFRHWAGWRRAVSSFGDFDLSGSRGQQVFSKWSWPGTVACRSARAWFALFHRC